MALRLSERTSNSKISKSVDLAYETNSFNNREPIPFPQYFFIIDRPNEALCWIFSLFNALKLAVPIISFFSTATRNIYYLDFLTSFLV